MNLDRDYSCYVGEPVVTLPSTLNIVRRVRSISISRFILNCELEDAVTPVPLYNWTKDGIPVIRNLRRGGIGTIEDEFYLEGDNSQLLLLMPQSPISVDSNLRLTVDFSLNPGIWNITALLPMFDPGTTVEDLRGLLHDAVAGNWTCTAANLFGSDSKSSVISSMR